MDRYALMARLGTGAFAGVYMALDRNMFNRPVAVKVLHPHHEFDSASAQRFLREIKFASRLHGLDRERLVQILDQGLCEVQDPPLLFFVMEYIPGPTLRQLLDRGRFPWATAVTLAYELCLALQALHGHEIVHRDIKPENCILVAEKSHHIKLLDLGIAKVISNSEATGDTPLTRTNVAVGTLRYMAPEQRSGTNYDHRADLYAVGVILYECLTGGPLKYDSKTGGSLHLRLPSQFSGIEVPPVLDAIVTRALSWDPSLRFQTADEFAKTLAAILPEAPSQSPALAQPSASAPSVSRSAQPSPVAAPPDSLSMVAMVAHWWLIIASVMIAAGTIFVGTWLLRSPPRVDPAAVIEDTEWETEHVRRQDDHK